MEEAPGSLTLVTPDTFDAFPYETPYPIQLDLMATLYSAIEARSLAIIESPTGTGKTLSLLTSALTWLNDDKSRSKKGKLASLKNSLLQGSGASGTIFHMSLSLVCRNVLISVRRTRLGHRAGS